MTPYPLRIVLQATPDPLGTYTPIYSHIVILWIYLYYRPVGQGTANDGSNNPVMLFLQSLLPSFNTTTVC